MPSKKHMEWAANYVCNAVGFFHKHPEIERDHIDTLHIVAFAFADFFTTFNPRFDRERFKRACFGLPCPTCGGTHNCRCKARARTVANALRKDA